MKNFDSKWKAKLQIVSNRAFEDQSPTYILSTTEDTVLGREPQCGIVIDSIQYSAVSRYHAKIQPVQSGLLYQWQVCDLNSSNGTYVNRVRLQGCKILQHGDRIMLGKDGPEFLFECEVVLPSVLSEAIQTVASEPLLPKEPILTPHSVPSPSQLLSAPVAPPTQPALADTTIEQNSSRSLWDLASEDIIMVLSGHGDLVRAVAFSSDNKLLASGSADKTVKIWDLRSGKEVQTLSSHKLTISAVAFSPDDIFFASGSADKTIKIWNLASGEVTQQLNGHGMGVSAVVFSPDGKLLASGSADKTIKIWDLISGEALQTLSGQKMGVNAVAFSLDGNLLASGSADRTVKLWSVESGEEVSTLPAFRSSINALFFSRNGETLAISTDDKMIRLWDLKLEQEIRVLSGYHWQVGGLAISLNGQLLASGSEDKTVKVWRL